MHCCAEVQIFYSRLLSKIFLEVPKSITQIINHKILDANTY